MIDYFLKFPDETAANALLFTPGPSDIDGAASQLFNFKGSVDVIGAIYKPTGKMIKNDMGAYPETAPIEGWHVNVRAEEAITELEPYAVTPAAPYRVWA